MLSGAFLELSTDNACSQFLIPRVLSEDNVVVVLRLIWKSKKQRGGKLKSYLCTGRIQLSKGAEV